MGLFSHASKSNAQAQQAIIASQFEPIDNTTQPLMSNEQAVFAAVVSLAKDMEFIGRGGCLLPDMQELSRYVKMCVPRIVKGEYLDSYFVNPSHCRPFYPLKGRGFEADDAMIDQALEKVQPIYQAILENIAKQKPNMLKKK